jgi:hypothetical protein
MLIFNEDKNWASRQNYNSQNVTRLPTTLKQKQRSTSGLKKKVIKQKLTKSNTEFLKSLGLKIKRK